MMWAHMPWLTLPVAPSQYPQWWPSSSRPKYSIMEYRVPDMLSIRQNNIISSCIYIKFYYMRQRTRLCTVQCLQQYILVHHGDLIQVLFSSFCFSTLCLWREKLPSDIPTRLHYRDQNNNWLTVREVTFWLIMGRGVGFIKEVCYSTIYAYSLVVI